MFKNITNFTTEVIIYNQTLLRAFFLSVWQIVHTFYHKQWKKQITIRQEAKGGGVAGHRRGGTAEVAGGGGGSLGAVGETTQFERRQPTVEETGLAVVLEEGQAGFGKPW